MKKCRKCLRMKKKREFYKCKQNSDARRSYCKPCYNEYNKPNVERYHENNQEIIRERKRKYDQSVKGRYSHHKDKARQRGIEYYLSLEDFSLFWRLSCFYCSFPTETVNLDRISNDGPYAMHNIIPAHPECNKKRNRHPFVEYCLDTGISKAKIVKTLVEKMGSIESDSDLRKFLGEYMDHIVNLVFELRTAA